MWEALSLIESCDSNGFKSCKLWQNWGYDFMYHTILYFQYRSWESLDPMWPMSYGRKGRRVLKTRLWRKACILYLCCGWIGKVTNLKCGKLMNRVVIFQTVSWFQEILEILPCTKECTFFQEISNHFRKFWSYWITSL